MAKPDYYEVLGVAHTASPNDLKKAYRQLAKKLHPDRNHNDPDAEHKFKEINEAYEVLKDEEKRAAFDRFGHAAFENGGMGNAAGFDFTGSFSDVFDDLFGEFTGQRRGSSGKTRGADLRYNKEITLEEAYTGLETSVSFTTSVNCTPCGGSGAAAGTSPLICGSCNGTGRVRSQQGFFTVERTCPTCLGNGRVISEPCPECNGGGRVQKQKTLNIKIPAGVDEGTRIRLAGKGEAGMRSAANGDLYIFLSIKPHRIFQREGPNIYCQIPVSMARASLGGAIEVPTLDGGRASLEITPGTQTGQQFRLNNKGMPVLNGSGYGDMIIRIDVETPVNLTKRQQELLEEFDREGDEKTNPETTGFFARVREFLENFKEEL